MCITSLNWQGHGCWLSSAADLNELPGSSRLTELKLGLNDKHFGYQD